MKKIFGTIMTLAFVCICTVYTVAEDKEAVDTNDVVLNAGVAKVIHAEPVLDEYEEKVDISEEEYEELAKIIMCEAEGEDFDGKVLIGNVVMNRVNSDKFPDDIISVIRQEHDGVHQFSPVGSGKIDSVTPSEECYKAVDAILNGYIISNVALYFESCSGESWHSRNLELLFKHGGHRFYK